MVTANSPPAPAGRGSTAFLLVGALVLVHYSFVIASSSRVIHWDASEYYFLYQKHFSDAIRAGKLPVWTSAIYSGFPFLADMQAGSWYPPNWPFFLTGVLPGTMFLELALHALLAAAGAWLLCRYLFGGTAGPAFAALSFALSGYFAAHSEHINLFQTAAYLPLALYLFLHAVERRSLRHAAAGALAVGLGCLTSHFQTALYMFAALGIAAFVATVERKGRGWRYAVGVLLLIAAGSVLVASVQLLPTAELLPYSLRARLRAADFQHGMVTGRSLATFLLPNAAGTFQSPYRGPDDITQHYFYSGFLLLPLASAGLIAGRRRPLAVALLLFAVLYSLGTLSPLYWLLIRLPGFGSVRAPSHSMHLAVLGLCLLAASAIARFETQRPGRIKILAVLAVPVFLDLFYWNMVRNPLVYAAGGSYQELHAPGNRWLREIARLPLPPLTRLAAPGKWVIDFGPDQLKGPETTFGSNPLMLAHYYDYLMAADRNPLLLSALGVSRYIEKERWESRSHSPVLARFYCPSKLLTIPDPATGFRLLNTMDPRESSLVCCGRASEMANGPATVSVVRWASDEYELDVRAEGDTVVRAAIPYFPGWSATISGKPAEVMRLDHALMGIRVPGGHHRVVFHYRPRLLFPGFALSAAAAILLLVVCAAPGLPGGKGREPAGLRTTS